MKTGKIIITDKVHFEPEGLPKPTGKKYRSSAWYNQDMERYEASKQKVEVENVWRPLIGPKSESVDYFLTNKNYIPKLHNELKLKSNQPCKAKIENNKAIIISLIK